MRSRWAKLGGQLGILYCLIGLALVFLGWNGAASYDRTSSQIPYVISGGIAGLCLVVIGTGLIVVHGHRADRAALEASLDGLRDSLGRLAEAEQIQLGDVVVLAGPNSYHRPDCRLIEGQEGLTPMRLAAAEQRGLDPCRICSPAS